MSEFDYIGWREWSDWKRKVLGRIENGVNANICTEGCGKCEFPSQCRYASTRTSAEVPAVHKKEIDAPSISPVATYTKEGETPVSICTNSGGHGSSGQISAPDSPLEDLNHIEKNAGKLSSKQSTLLSPITEEIVPASEIISSSSNGKVVNDRKKAGGTEHRKENDG